MEMLDKKAEKPKTAEQETKTRDPRIRTLYVKNLSDDFPVLALHETFYKFKGYVTSQVKCVKEGCEKKVGFVIFSTNYDARQVLDYSTNHGITVTGVESMDEKVPLEIEFARTNTKSYPKDTIVVNGQRMPRFMGTYEFTPKPIKRKPSTPNNETEQPQAAQQRTPELIRVYDQQNNSYVAVGDTYYTCGCGITIALFDDPTYVSYSCCVKDNSHYGVFEKSDGSHDVYATSLSEKPLICFISTNDAEESAYYAYRRLHNMYDKRKLRLIN